MDLTQLFIEYIITCNSNKGLTLRSCFKMKDLIKLILVYNTK